MKVLALAATAIEVYQLKDVEWPTTRTGHNLGFANTPGAGNCTYDFANVFHCATQGGECQSECDGGCIHEAMP
jgi:hypothetical protein